MKRELKARLEAPKEWKTRSMTNDHLTKPHNSNDITFGFLLFVGLDMPMIVKLEPSGNFGVLK